MNKKFTKLMAALALLTILAVPIGMRGQTRAEEVYSTCLFGASYNSDGVQNYTSTWTATNGGFTWTIENGNNNNNIWNFIKFGRKNVTSVGTITTKDSYSEAITKVVLTIDAITAANVNSIKLYTSNDNADWTEAGEFTKAADPQTVTLANPTANLYYKVEFDCASGSGNGLVTVSKVEYYHESGSSTAVATTTTIDASGITNTDVYTSTTAGSLSATVTETESGDAVSGATVTWSGDNDDVATIDASSGEVTLVAAGSVTFTASYAGVTDEYQASSATYVMNVTSSAPSITFTDNGSSYTPVDAYHVALPCDASGGYVAHVVSENFQTSLVASDFHVEFCDVNGEALPVDPNWLEFVRVTLMPEWAQDETLYLEVSAYANETDESRTAYFKVWALNGNDMVYSDIVTVTQAKVEVDYATLPFEWEGGSSATFNALTGVTTYGLGSDYSDSHNPYYIKFDSDNDYIQVKTNEQPGKVTIGVKMIGGANASSITVKGSADGETFTDVQTLSISGSQNSTLSLETTNAFATADRYVRLVFNKGSNVGVGPITIAKVSTDPSITLNTYAVEATADETEGTLDITYANLTISDMSDFGIQFYDANEEELNGDNVPNWILVEVAEQDPQVGEGYVVSYVIDANTGEARTAYFKVFADGGNDFVYSNLVTVTQEAYVEPFASFTCTLATEIVSGKHYIITNGDTKAMGYQNTNNRPAADIELNETTATVSSEDVYEFVIIGPDVDGYYTIYDVKNESYLYAASSSSNQLKTQSTYDNNGRWSISIDSESGAATIVAQGDNTNKYMRFNSALFSCYGETSSVSALPFLYAKDGEAAVSYDLTIDGYGESEGGYRLIAAPVGSAMNLSDNGFLTDDYDLYYFDQNENGAEWRNYKDQATGDWDIVSGRGYLYASKADATLHFVGYPYVGNGQVVLSYTEDNTFAGWNLIGNPFATAATLDNAYYRLNSDGSELNAETESGSVAAMEGVFVKATEAGFAKFTATATQNAVPQLNVNLASSNRGSSTLDRAIIRFDEGSQLPKFMLNEANAKLYIPQGTKDYAVVRSNNEGSMPVNFKADKNGSFTLNVDAANLDVDYLHLIDNLTGTDIDLLQTPSYTFDARTSDYASRFRLVFSINNVPENEDSHSAFAYFNGSEWVINASNNATVQVVDVMGRVILNADAKHGVSTANMPAGVYMLRLVNGNNVKVQKIVVR